MRVLWFHVFWQLIHNKFILRWHPTRNALCLVIQQLHSNINLRTICLLRMCSKPTIFLICIKEHKQHEKRAATSEECDFNIILKGSEGFNGSLQKKIWEYEIFFQHFFLLERDLNPRLSELEADMKNTCTPRQNNKFCLKMNNWIFVVWAPMLGF